MPSILRADLARLVGVSRSAVTQAIERKSVVVSPDGTIDTDDPVNSAWIAAKVSKNPAPPRPPSTSKKEKPAPRLPLKEKPKPPPLSPPPLDIQPPKGDTVSPPQVGESQLKIIEEMVQASAEKLRLTVARRKQAEADTHLKDIRAAREKKELIPRELVRQRFAAFDAALKTNIRDMPRRISAQIYALAKAGDARDVEAYLEQELGLALARSTESAKGQDLQ